MSTISLLGCSTSVALATGPTDEEEEEEEVRYHSPNVTAQHPKRLVVLAVPLRDGGAFEQYSVYHSWQHSPGKCVCSKGIVHLATPVIFGCMPRDLLEICRKADEAEGWTVPSFRTAFSKSAREKWQGDRTRVSNTRPKATFLNCVCTG